MSYTFGGTVDKNQVLLPIDKMLCVLLRNTQKTHHGWQILRKEPRCGARKTQLLHDCDATVLRLHPVVSFLAKATTFCAKTRTRGWNFATICLPCGEGCHTGQICTTFAQKKCAPQQEKPHHVVGFLSFKLFESHSIRRRSRRFRLAFCVFQLS